MNGARKKRLRLFAALLGVTASLAVLAVSITMFDDSVSRRLRAVTEKHVNRYAERLTDRASRNVLGTLDRVLLHAGVLAGVAVSRLRYPEASALLYHYVYGDGSELELASDYFETSPYLKRVIHRLGEGEHGPTALRQAQDWRLSLALNPYYLTVTPQAVRLYHPRIAFAPLNDARRIWTVVPVGKMKLKIYDGLVNALEPTPFAAYSQWPRDRLARCQRACEE